MGKIHIDLFTTLDLVAQAPGGPDEDPEGDFRYGGWQAPLTDEVVGDQITGNMPGIDALLLGRRTYDIFAAYWPHQTGEIADRFNEIPKYVATRGRLDLDWTGATAIGADLAGEVRALRGRHAETHVIGSLDLVQTLLRERLFDQLNLWVYPITLGTGKKVFDGGAVPSSLTLLEPPLTSPKGAVLLRYGLEPGTPGTGQM
ncbi:dihydrofolate reductase family protein [Actinoplanes utahensis]|uniref:Deaminase n=1 Tax=Actinoplanes utahensis TaxID=1869 RepID=A0A0A6UIY9_ACTUT|nr:dihydrofolate reductase family protein [Actinoplanes utahensis]KHD74274.1 deaminase [Actinoplanes utahensis]GIF31556.1 deaminase reductase [Actinoplanes utahensis]